MPIDNLAKVFGPTLVGYSSDNPSPDNLLNETRMSIAVRGIFLYNSVLLMYGFQGVQRIAEFTLGLLGFLCQYFGTQNPRSNATNPQHRFIVKTQWKVFHTAKCQVI